VTARRSEAVHIEEARMSKPWRTVLIVLVLAFVVDVAITYFTMY
jgi:hypothetical protein